MVDGPARVDVADQARPQPYFWHAPGADLFLVTVRARDRVVAATHFNRAWLAGPVGERHETVQSAGFDGSFFAAPTARHRTAVLVFGGSEGGLSTGLLASRFAADGYPALALAYFKEPGLPQTLTNIPLEYFQRALAWLATQPQVDPSRIVVVGISRGSEAALLLGVHYPELVHGVIALVPSSVVNCGITGAGHRGGCIGVAWTLAGNAVPYTRQFNNPNPSDVPAAIIPVERIKAPILLACGGADTTWNSCAFSHAIVNRARDNSSPPRLYAYPYAGHDVGVLLPDEPGQTQYDFNIPFDEQAREQLWPHVLAFLRQIP